MIYPGPGNVELEDYLAFTIVFTCIFPGHLCCNEIMQRHWPYGMAFDADMFSNEYEVICDQMATNGVVHISNNLAIMPYAHSKNPLLRYL